MADEVVEAIAEIRALPDCALHGDKPATNGLCDLCNALAAYDAAQTKLDDANESRNFAQAVARQANRTCVEAEELASDLRARLAKVEAGRDEIYQWFTEVNDIKDAIGNFSAVAKSADYGAETLPQAVEMAIDRHYLQGKLDGKVTALNEAIAAVEARDNQHLFGRQGYETEVRRRECQAFIAELEFMRDKGGAP